MASSRKTPESKENPSHTIGRFDISFDNGFGGFLSIVNILDGPNRLSSGIRRSVSVCVIVLVPKDLDLRIDYRTGRKSSQRGRLTSIGR